MIRYVQSGARFMDIKYASVLVDDQEKALSFYTETLGFAKMADISLGSFRWLTVSNPDNPQGAELVLQPLGFPPDIDQQKSRFEAGIPSVAFTTADLDGEYIRLQKAGVKFRGEPRQMGAIAAVLFEDTCGNLINLVQPSPPS